MKNLVNIAEKNIALAIQQGADQAEISISNETGFEVNARQGDVETVEHHQAQGLTVTVYKDHRVGSATTSDLAELSVAAAVKKACSIAKFAGQDQFSGLADAEHMAKHYPDLELYHPWQITTAEAIQMAIECETVARQQDKRIIHAEGASVATYNIEYVYGNSHGFVGKCLSTTHRLSCGVVAKENEQMQRDYEYSVARKAEALEDATLIAKQAAHKTLRRLGAKKIKTQQCPVIFYAPVAKSLLGAFIGAIAGRNLYTKSSFLLDHLNKAIFPNHIDIYQQPHLLGGMGSAPFDSEGVATSDRHYVKDGELVSYVLGSYSARKLNLQTTGNAGGVYNLKISHGQNNLGKLLAEMGTGLLITEMMGQGINLTTGDYSRGASGFWVADGEIQHPVEEITIAGNLRDMFAGIVEVGNDVDSRGNIQTGSILINQMMVAGN